MSKHEHPEPKPPCAHESLKFCAKCDAVECTACGSEWKKPSVQMCFREHADEARKVYRWPTFPNGNPQLVPDMPWPNKIWAGIQPQPNTTNGQFTSGFITLAHKDHQ